MMQDSQDGDVREDNNGSYVFFKGEWLQTFPRTADEPSPIDCSRGSLLLALLDDHALTHVRQEAIEKALCRMVV